MRRLMRRQSTAAFTLSLMAAMLLAGLLGGAAIHTAAARLQEDGQGRHRPCAGIVHGAIAASARLDAALADLVTEGVLTEAQADAVSDRVAEPPTAEQLNDAAATATPAIRDGGRGEEHRDRMDRAGHCVAAARSLQATVQAVSDLLGLDPAAILERLAAGESLAEIAESQGVSRDDLIATLQTQVDARLDAAEAAGWITPEERAAREAAVTERIDTLVDHHGGDQLPPATP